jgi:hypothetical protein
LVPRTASYHRNFARYGTAHKLSSLPSNPRVQTTDVLVARTQLWLECPTGPAPLWIGPQRSPSNFPSKLGCGTDCDDARLRGRRR